MVYRTPMFTCASTASSLVQHSDKPAGACNDSGGGINAESSASAYEVDE